MTGRTRVLCGTVAALCVASLGGARGDAAGCRQSLVHVGAVSARGCWTRAHGRATARTPVVLNGLTLAGGGTVAVDAAHGTIRSSGAVRWRFGRVQILRGPFAWTRGRTLPLTPAGAIRGLPFHGAATLAFTRSAGGTAVLRGLVTVPTLAGGLSGDVVLGVSRLHGFDVRSVHVTLPQLPLQRLVFQDLDFAWTGAAWHAAAKVTLPGFGGGAPAVAGTVDVAAGKLKAASAEISGIAVPLADGFQLTAAGLAVGFSPFSLGGDATAVLGPKLGGSTALQVEGGGTFATGPEEWRAEGKVSLPWLPAFSPSASAKVAIDPGTAMRVYDGSLRLTVHHWGVKGSFAGFATGSAFNAEGAATLDLPGPVNLDGSALVSSRGSAACGKVFFGPHVGFGYRWGGALDVMFSSCDVGPWRVTQHIRKLGTAIEPIPVSGVPFEVFAAQGGDFVVTAPDGTTYSSVTERNGPDAFVTHDPDDGWAYVVVPAPPDGLYAIAPAGAAPLTTVNAADGMPDPEVGGGVSGSGGLDTLSWTIGGLVPGEAVSFYQGASPDQPGAAPIVEDVGNGGGSQTFAPEPLGPTDRYVWAVVTVDGLPRSVQRIAQFTAAPAPPPGPTTARLDPSAGGWTVTEKTPRAATFRVDATYADGRVESLTARAGSALQLPGTAADEVKAVVTPYDAFGRPGAAVTCDSAAPGFCK